MMQTKKCVKEHNITNDYVKGIVPEAGSVFDLEGGALGEDVEGEAAHVEGVVVLPPRDARRHQQTGVVLVAQADPGKESKWHFQRRVRPTNAN